MSAAVLAAREECEHVWGRGLSTGHWQREGQGCKEGEKEERCQMHSQLCWWGLGRTAVGVRGLNRIKGVAGRRLRVEGNGAVAVLWMLGYVVSDDR